MEFVIGDRVRLVENVTDWSEPDSRLFIQGDIFTVTHTQSAFGETSVHLVNNVGERLHVWPDEIEGI